MLEDLIGKVKMNTARSTHAISKVRSRQAVKENENGGRKMDHRIQDKNENKTEPKKK